MVQNEIGLVGASVALRIELFDRRLDLLICGVFLKRLYLEWSQSHILAPNADLMAATS